MNRPRDLALAALCLAALGPVLTRVGGAKIGSFGMFTEHERCRLTVTREAADGTHAAVPIAHLAPHLGRDARRVILPAGEGAIGETQIGLLAGGLDDIGRLVCAIEPGARAAEVALQRFRLDGRPLASGEARVPCGVSAR